MITVRDIREKEFVIEKDGYSMAEVDDFLDQIADENEMLIRELRDLSARVKEAEEKLSAAAEAPAEPDTGKDSAYFKNLESTLRETLISAQRNADDTVTEAQEKAASAIADAEEQAAAIIAAAKAEADNIKAASDALRAKMQDYRTRFVSMVEDQLQCVKNENEIFE